MPSSPFVRTNPNPAPRATLYSYQRPVGTSFIVHAGLATGTWLVGVSTDRPQAKDWLWPVAPVVNTWYQAVGIPVVHYGLPVGVALSGLTWRQTLMLGGVTTWGVHNLVQTSSKTTKRTAADVRYNKDKRDPSSPNSSLIKACLTEALFQTLVTLPLVAPFRSSRVALEAWGWTDMAGVACFTAGLTLGVLADSQRRSARKAGVRGVCRTGVWSVVRRPDALADAEVQLGFALLAVNTPAYSPWIFAAPLVNYVYLRYFAHDVDAEPVAASTERFSDYDPAKDAQIAKYKRDTNAFWPAPAEFTNVWMWVVVVAGVAGVGVEKVVRAALRPAVL